MQRLHKSPNTRITLQSLILCLCLSSCILEPFQLQGYPCTPEKECAKGETCINGVCRPKEATTTPCQTPSDCPQGLVCKQQLCASASCSKDTDCPNGELCDNAQCRLPKVSEACLPLNGCQSPAICINDTQGSVCRTPCDPLGMQPCPANQGCSLLDSSLANGSINGVCLPLRQGQAAGEPCDESKRCEVQLRCLYDGQRSLCRSICNPEKPRCSSGEQCIKIDNKRPQIGVCLPQNCDTVPDLCKSDTTCFQGVCRKNCNLQNPQSCAANEYCNTSNGKNFCVERECQAPGRTCALPNVCEQFRCVPLPTTPKPCSKNEDCTNTTLCVQGPENKSFCLQPCTLSQTSPCPAAYVCVPLSTASPSAVCFPKSGGLPVGWNCDASKPCEHDLVCATAGNRTQCFRLCDPRLGAEVCADPLAKCIPLNDSKLGVCLHEAKTRKTSEVCSVSIGNCVDGNLCVIQTGQGAAYCRKNCDDDSACNSGETCTSLEGSNQKVCLSSP